MLPFKLVYCDAYDLNLGDHVFPSSKYRLIQKKLLSEGIATPGDFLTPSPATDEEILLVHDREWVQKLKCGQLSYADIMRLEIPYSPQMVEAVWLAAGGSTLAARWALLEGAAMNLGGGFHHAFAGHGEGFCAIHDVAVAIRCLQRDGAIARALVVDCDVHHGNGTASIFGGDDSVFTVSLHQLNNYPSAKPPSDIDIDLADGVGDDEYLLRLREALDLAFQNQFDLLCYVAGADPFHDDSLGGLSLTMEGLRHRDTIVIEAARKRGVPVMVTLAGGYAQRVEDTVEIHVNTARALKEAL